MTGTPYPYPTGTDPTYDAQAAKINYQRQQAQQDYTFKQGMADENYKRALDSLTQQTDYGKRNIDNSMLARGVYSSGETNRRQAELQANMLTQRASLDATKANLFGQASSDLQRALLSLDMQGQAAMNAAMNRGRGGTTGMGARPVTLGPAGAAGAVPTAPQTTPPPYSLMPAGAGGMRVSYR